MWSSYDALKTYDVVIGQVPMHQGQQEGMDFAVGYGIRPIHTPFTQVVLLTDAGKYSPSRSELNSNLTESDIAIAMGKLTWVDTHPLDPAVGEKQDKMIKDLAAQATAAEQAQSGCSQSGQEDDSQPADDPDGSDGSDGSDDSDNNRIQIPTPPESPQ
jgi:hypothetical protein